MIYGVTKKKLAIKQRLGNPRLVGRKPKISIENPVGKNRPSNKNLDTSPWSERGGDTFPYLGIEAGF